LTIQQPAGRRFHAEHVEIIPRDQIGVDALRTPFAGPAIERHRDRAVRGQTGEGTVAIAVIQIIGVAEIIEDVVFLNAIHRDQAPRIGNRGKRSQQHRVHHAEYRNIRADSQRQRGDRGQGEARILQHAPDGVPQIAQHEL